MIYGVFHRFFARFNNKFKEEYDNWKWNPSEYRIKEERHESGVTKFFPEVKISSNRWMSLSHKMYGLNHNGEDWCDTIEDSQKVIEHFRDFYKRREDKIMKEIIHKY